MAEIWTDIQAFFTGERLASLLRVALILIGGWLCARLLGAMASRLAHRGTAGSAMLSRLARYAVYAAAVLLALSELGFDAGVLLGAAGVLTVAVGFASQASASNIISGFFLMAERAFEIGDNIVLGDMTGQVIAIDLLSVKLRTFDNLFVRLPNELVLKTPLKNLSRFPIRRLDIQLTLPYDARFDDVRAVLREVAQKHPLCFDEPPPLIVFTGLGDHGYNVQYSVWIAKEAFVDVRGTLHAEVVGALHRAGVALAMPRTMLYRADSNVVDATRPHSSELS